MKTFFFILTAALFVLNGCSDIKEDLTEEPTEKEEITETEPTYDHILSEAYDEQKSIHYFDPNVMVYERMILPIEIDENGAFRLNGRSSSFDELAAEMRLFYFANKDLGQRMTNVHRDDEFYKYKHYPLFVYFDKAGFKSYLDRLESMAKNDSTAQKYLKCHQSRFKSFQVVEEGTVLPFLEFGALISIGFEEETDPEAIAEVENKVAENIHAFRNEIAQEEFGTSYERIRDMARKEPTSKMQLMYLKEMVPAYIMKGNGDQLSSSLMQEPPLPPPPPMESITIKENEPD
ncbi:MAG: hypothetical protein Crog4KO_08340 [Crocinitomicaceae bacterium]